MSYMNYATKNYQKIKENYQKTIEKVSLCSLSAGRDPNSIKIVVVSKGHSIDTIETAIEIGINKFGENYVEEGIRKISKIRQNKQCEWHMIGHIQSRKAYNVVEYFDYVHSLDSVKLANKLNNYAIEARKIIPILVECNTSGELTKYGFSLSSKKDSDEFIELFEELISLPNLQIRGLMTMAPYYENPESARPYFQMLRNLKEKLNVIYPSIKLTELSMGMSSDYCIAIHEGATIIRVGTAILGPRQNTK